MWAAITRFKKCSFLHRSLAKSYKFTQALEPFEVDVYAKDTFDYELFGQKISTLFEPKIDCIFYKKSTHTGLYVRWSLINE